MKFSHKISCALLVCAAVMSGPVVVAQGIITSLGTKYCPIHSWRGMTTKTESAFQVSGTVFIDWSSCRVSAQANKGESK